MCRAFAISLAAILSLLVVSAELLAGGLPRFCLPIDGATAENADQCGQRIAAALDELSHVEMRQNEGQWYVMFHFNREPVRLSEIDAALEGSPFSVPRDKLCPFGEVVLEIDLPGGAPDKLLADLAATKFVAIGERGHKLEGNDMLLVNLEIPAPDYFGGKTADFGKIPFTTEVFRRPDGSDAAMSGELPSYAALSELAQKHDARLTGLRWNCLACRVLGCLAAPAPDRTATSAPRVR